jgi:hypothetical protein
VPDTRHDDAGWYVPNSITPRDCIPSYRLAGGGVSQKQLTDFPDAIDQAITNIRQRKYECDALIEKLELAKERVLEEQTHE